MLAHALNGEGTGSILTQIWNYWSTKRSLIINVLGKQEAGVFQAPKAIVQNDGGLKGHGFCVINHLKILDDNT